MENIYKFLNNTNFRELGQEDLQKIHKDTLRTLNIDIYKSLINNSNNLSDETVKLYLNNKLKGFNYE